MLKHHNVPRGPIKRIAWDIGRLASTKDKILELLHDFVSQFLLGAYNGKSFGNECLFEQSFFLQTFNCNVVTHLNAIQLLISFDAIDS